MEDFLQPIIGNESQIWKRYPGTRVLISPLYWTVKGLIMALIPSHLRNYPHTPIDYRHTDKHLRLVMIRIALY